MCKEGHLNGETNTYYENGQLAKNSMYANDVREGVTHTDITKVGLQRVSATTRTGNGTVPIKIYCEDGLIKEFTVYKKGVDVGIG